MSSGFECVESFAFGLTAEPPVVACRGEEWAVGGVFSEVRPPERLAFTFRWEEDDPALERDTFVTVELLDRGPETEMIFTHSGFKDDASRDNHRTGWTQCFDNLAVPLA